MTSDKIRVLNLYAGIGGNRKLWPDNVEVTAVEIDPFIARIYQVHFPQDHLVTADAHEYLLENFQAFDFIWSSPPCPSHSVLRKNMATNIPQDQPRSAKPVFPDMKLYEEIIFLQHHFKGLWIVENVRSYYDPLIKPQKLQRHYFWSNFVLPKPKLDDDNIMRGHYGEWQEKMGFDLSKFKFIRENGHRKEQILCNCVRPELGLAIFQAAFKNKQKGVHDYAK